MSEDKASIKLENHCLQVSGDIDFGSVVSLWNESLPLIAASQKVVVDLSRVKSVNSAALALMLEWMKYAKRECKTILFQNLPKQLVSIATVAGIGNFVARCRV
ncbi:MAG: STAS domain-containing protein [Gammaproteobacteria bacterium]